MPPAGRSFVTPCVVLGLYLNPTESDMLSPMHNTFAAARVDAAEASSLDVLTPQYIVSVPRGYNVTTTAPADRFASCGFYIDNTFVPNHEDMPF